MLEGLARPRRTCVDNLELWDVDEVARRLKLARSRVYTLIMAGEIESIKIGKSRRITPQALARFIGKLKRAQSQAS